MAFNEQISKVMPHENFSINLRIVCDEQISVAHVCRKMEINRQQFNKYLSGQIYPSKHNLNRICQYFQLLEEEFNLKSSEFRQIARSNGFVSLPHTSNEIWTLVPIQHLVN